MIAKTFLLDDQHSITGVARAIDAFLRREERMNVTRYRREDGSYLICARAKEGRALRWVGLDRMVCARVLPADGSYATVQVQGGRWRDKGLALCASLFMLWPLAISAGVGGLRQACLPRQILCAVQHYLRSAPDAFTSY